jgi:hypothetical protein
MSRASWSLPVTARVYHLNRENGRLIWAFSAPDKAFNSWFEGNVQIGHDGNALRRQHQLQLLRPSPRKGR